MFDFGATPLSSIRSPVDVMISGPDMEMLDRSARTWSSGCAGTCATRRRSRAPGPWTRRRSQFTADPEKLALYQISPAAVAGQLAGAVRGMPGSVFRIPNQDGLTVLVQFPADRRANAEQVATYSIVTPKGEVPLAATGHGGAPADPSVITRQGLAAHPGHPGLPREAAHLPYAGRRGRPSKGLELPAGYTISHEGEIKQMTESFGRLGWRSALGMVLLYFSLVPAFKSWIHPLTIMSAIPLALIGAAWGMLIMDKHGCMPSMMGMILLAGIVVKNSILLIDFIAAAKERGASNHDALMDSVRVRTRPILMTAVGTSVGMIPIARSGPSAWSACRPWRSWPSAG